MKTLKEQLAVYDLEDDDLIVYSWLDNSLAGFSYQQMYRSGPLDDSQRKLLAVLDKDFNKKKPRKEKLSEALKRLGGRDNDSFVYVYRRYGLAYARSVDEEALDGDRDDGTELLCLFDSEKEELRWPDGSYSKRVYPGEANND